MRMRKKLLKLVFGRRGRGRDDHPTAPTRAALSALLAVTLSRLVLVTLMPLVLAAEPKQHEPVEP